MATKSIQFICLENLAKTNRLPAGALSLLSADVERARVVGVLDAWDEAHPDREAFSAFKSAGALVPSHAYVCARGYNSTLELAYYGPTRDAARAAAAKAIEDGEV